MNINDLTKEQFDGQDKILGSLDLRSLTSIPEGFNKNKYCLKKMNLISFKNGKYILVDGIFTEVISKKKNVWKVKKINKTDIFYCVTDGNGKYAHGKTIKEAKADLIYKITDFDTSKYKAISIETVMPFDKCIEMYRAITGACSFGVKSFIADALVNFSKFRRLH